MDNLTVEKKDNCFVVVAYHEGNDIAFQVTVPADKYTEKEAHIMGNMAQRAISAFFGYRDNEEKIRNIVNHTALGFPTRYVNDTMKRLMQDSIGLAAATIFGFHAHEKDVSRTRRSEMVH